jgi:hypothetical protein
MAYNRIERRVAAFLDNLPALRRVARSGYQRLNYVLHGGRGPRVVLHPKASLARLAPPAGDAGGEAFFGYFGIAPWSGDGRGFLFHRWRRGESRVEIWRADGDGGHAQVVGHSAAWNFQQGSMAQWIGARADGIVFNDCVDDRIVCRILEPGAAERRLPWPVQAIHPAGGEALSLDYRRLGQVQPEYGYAEATAGEDAETARADDGLWRVSLANGDARLVVSMAALAARDPRPEMLHARHAVNHAVYSPRGERIAFMHRWLGARGLFSRLYVTAPDGSGLTAVLDHRMVSHYSWRDEATLLVYARSPLAGDRYYVLDATTGSLAPFAAGVVDRFGDGHPSCSPDGRWFVTDTYPDRARMRRLFLCQTGGGKAIELGAFFSPWRYDGAVRCDLHPRWDRAGRRISIDSAHEGCRATYVVDVAGVQALF